MVTMAQRIELLRAERGLSRPALSAALGLPRLAAEKFETGRQTPTQEQQERMAAYFGVSVSYLRGETGDRTSMEDWMAGGPSGGEDDPAPSPARPRQKAAPSGGEESALLGVFLKNEKFQETLRAAVLDVLRSPEGQELLNRAVSASRRG
jgi:transcriptional regulator with XRE-family HTH domain